MRKILWVFLPIILLGVGTNSTFACTCGSTLITKVKLMEGKIDGTGADRAWIDEYPGVIFAGQVIKIKKVQIKLPSSDYWPNHKVTFKVDRYWKGDSPEVIVFTGVGGGSCGFRFRKKQSYIVFAQMIENRLQTGICDFTSESHYAENIIKGLNLGDGRFAKTESTKQ